MTFLSPTSNTDGQVGRQVDGIRWVDMKIRDESE